MLTWNKPDMSEDLMLFKTLEKQIHAATLFTCALFLILTLSGCSTTGKTFDEYIEANLLDSANKVFLDNEEEFIGKPKKYKHRIDNLAIALDNQLLSRNKGIRDRARQAIEDLEDPNSWKALRGYVENLDRKIKRIESKEIYALRPELFPTLKADRELLKSIIDIGRSHLPERLRTWDLAQKENVFREYGFGTSENEIKALFETKLIQDIPALVRLPKSDLSRVRRLYSAIWPEKVDQAVGKAAVSRLLRDATLESQRVSFIELQFADQAAKLLGVDINRRPSDIILVSESEGSAITVRLGQENDLISINTLSRIKAAEAIEHPIFSPPVFIIPRATLVKETLVETVNVVSNYQSAIVRKANPDYIKTTELLTELKQELLEAERTLTSNSSSFDDLLDTANPDLPNGLKALMGLAAIANQASTVTTDFKVMDLEERIASAERRLATMPRMVSEPKMSRYEFEVKKAKVDRQEHLTLAIFDMFSDSFDIYQVKINHENTFRVPLGMYANDKKANAYDDMASYMSAIQEPLIIEYDELVDLVQPNSPGHLVSNLPKNEFKNLLLADNTRDSKK